MNFDTIRHQIIRAGGVPGEPAQERDFLEFEDAHRIKLVPQVKANYRTMNGSAYCTEPGGSWMRFWPLGGTFVCADYGHECVYFAVDLTSPEGRVYGLGKSRAGVAGADFNEFIARVAEDSDEVHNYS